MGSKYVPSQQPIQIEEVDPLDLHYQTETIASGTYADTAGGYDFYIDIF